MIKIQYVPNPHGIIEVLVTPRRKDNPNLDTPTRSTIHIEEQKGGKASAAIHLYFS